MRVIARHRESGTLGKHNELDLCLTWAFCTVLTVLLLAVGIHHHSPRLRVAFSRTRCVLGIFSAVYVFPFCILEEVPPDIRVTFRSKCSTPQFAARRD
ncbi:hypothetical protein V8D89_003432 [Ganoderma adspersum]